MICGTPQYKMSRPEGFVPWEDIEEAPPPPRNPTSTKSNRIIYDKPFLEHVLRAHAKEHGHKFSKREYYSELSGKPFTLIMLYLPNVPDLTVPNVTELIIFRMPDEIEPYKIENAIQLRFSEERRTQYTLDELESVPYLLTVNDDPPQRFDSLASLLSLFYNGKFLYSRSLKYPLDIPPIVREAMIEAGTISRVPRVVLPYKNDILEIDVKSSDFHKLLVPEDW